MDMDGSFARTSSHRVWSAGWRAIAGVALAVGIAACGTAITAGERPVTMTESTSASAAAAAAAAAVRLYVDDDAKAALLTLGDMPAGYAVDVEESKSATSSEPGCAGRWFWGENSWPSREARFGKGAMGPFIFHSVTAAPTEKQARDFVTELRAMLAECPVFKDSDGSTYTLSQTDHGSFGDETFALRMAVSTVLGPFTTDLVAIRKVNLLSLIGGAGPLSEASDLPQVVEKAAAKLPT